jgi:rhomboid family GlyGly-CTERM serine protease
LRPGIRRLEWIAIASLLVVCNWHLTQGTFPSILALFPEPAMDGEFWRWVTHAFAHLSWYHLIVDASAFLMLYHSLENLPWTGRLSATSSAIAGSAIAAMTDPRTAEIGLCGMSGCAHGLMAFVALCGLKSGDKLQRQFGWLALAAVVLKCMVEAVSGGAFFVNWHLGAVGIPIGACHAGGVIGALLYALPFPNLSVAVRDTA